VQDNGPGLPGDLQENLFKRFTRGDKARHTPGNGLGLSLVAAVAKLHGLTLAVEDAMPGCRVRIGG
jgi:signal transduction histidine kinase